ncbi:unnamed protein product [Gongylonema pulchrum]|uniref:KH_dom_type_1 domain-containing protein n=1 Tax=Gongylonema pulchrum TaxID=637853 RepID=A0A183D855_9BILA|nr:unnamed protein product [Gongylonema pulchrum]
MEGAKDCGDAVELPRRHAGDETDEQASPGPEAHAAESAHGNSPPSEARYLGELVEVLLKLGEYRNQQIGGRDKFRLTYGLVIREIDRVWNLVYARARRNGILPYRRYVHEIPTTRLVVLEEKVPIPERPECKFIGRILGPRGMSVKQLEARTQCTISIHGRGSVKVRIQCSELL